MKKSNRLLNMAILASMVLVLAFGITQPVAAFEINNTGRLSRNEVVDDDLFIAAEKVVVDGTVNGILFAAGNEVIINGTVNGDVFAGAQAITIGEGAKINGSLFTGAQTVEVSGEITGSVFTGVMSLILNENTTVGRNLYFGGYSLEAKPGSVISRDLVAGGYQVILDGEVSRDVKAGVAAFKLDGSIGRNAQIQVEKPGTAQGAPYTGPWSPQTGNIKMIDPGLTIGEGASIGGNLVYTSPINQTSGMQSTPQGTIVFQTPVPSESNTRQPTANIRFDSVLLKILSNMARNFITLLALGALALWLIPLTVKGVSEKFTNKTLPSLGYGFLTYLVGLFGSFFAFMAVVFAAIILGLISFGGLGGVVFWAGSSSLLVAFTVFMTLVLWGTKIIATFVVGRFILERIFKQGNANLYLSLLIGVIIYVLLRAIPIFGWLVDVFVTIVGLGAMWIYFRERTKPAVTVVTSVKSETALPV